MPLENAVREMLVEHAAVLEAFRSEEETLGAMGRKAAEVLARGGKILSCGNGGSATQAEHFAGELVGRFRIERIPLPGIALNSAMAGLTAIGNDYHYDQVFERGVAAHGREGDMLLALSTSGASANVLKAVAKAKEIGMFTAGLAGRDGGPLAKACDLCVVSRHKSTARVQEMHILAIHIVCEIIDRAFSGPEA